MFMLAHKDDCSIVVNGPTEESPAFSASDGKGGSQEIVHTYARVCTCGGTMVDVTDKVYVPWDKSQPAALVTSSGACSCR